MPVVTKITNINDYAKQASATAIYAYPDYPIGLLSQEANEVGDKVFKYARDNKVTVAGACRGIKDSEPELLRAISKELGDTLWAWVNVCREFDLDPAEVMAQNIAKVTDRSARGKLTGAGDDR